ncbi:MAG TPA: sigma-70 family RNA polymerase sigma factor [Methylomirabilota bacterium]|nr:sigma-70 family RNA polymerase sigma factor [Methylomirabilota bacterium]
MSQETPDETLLQRVAARDEAAFDLLVARHQGRAYRLAWSLLRDAEDARDLSQEAFLRVYRTAGSFRGEARFSTWFYRILVNLCLDHQRRGRWWRRLTVRGGGEDPEDDVLERQPAPAADPAEALGRDQVMARVWAHVDRLAPQQRAALLLQVQEDLSTSEIAQVLACSEATVRVHLHRAVSALRKTMGRG